jgi:GNAT superfamily N-acetyltransferase
MSDDGTIEISCDRDRLDIDAIHEFLTQSYWSPGVPKEVVCKAIANSLCFGVFQGTRQIGFARVTTDKATFAYLADVFVLEEFRGQGLGKRLIASVMAHPELQGLRRFMLATRDAHQLYARYGFTPIAAPSRLMEVLRPDVYREELPDR